ncbi:MAG: helix-turn-helix domain-containing protein [Ilumatobacteraceae bacterium]
MSRGDVRVGPAGSSGSSGSSGSFTATVSAITDAFGDPTRRRVYLLVREQPDPTLGLTAGQVADHIGVHPNVARHHLDKLAAGGYLEVSTARVAGASTAGRPSKRYRPPAADRDGRGADVPVHADDLVLALLGRALDQLPPDTASALAEEVGAEYGRAMASALTGDALTAGQRSLRSAMQAVASALTAHGFAAHTERHNNRLRIINEHCPFGDVATDHPVICAVDRGMVRGMLDQLCTSGNVDVAMEASKAFGDTMCATSV